MDAGKDRLDYLDVTKGIGIILVCIGHACTNQAVIAECRYAGLIRFITLFHMALFFFVNGMLYNEKYTVKPVRGCLKKIKAYYIPFVIYNLIFWALHNLFAKLHLISGALDPKDYAYTTLREFIVSFVKSIIGFRQRFAGAMWFLESLIVTAVVFILVDYFATRRFAKKRIVVISVSLAIITLVNHLLNLYSIPGVPASISRMIYWGLNGLVFFYCGYLYRNSGLNEKMQSKKLLLALLFGGVVIVTTILMSPRIASAVASESIPIYKAGLNAIAGYSKSGGLSLIQFVLYGVVGLCGILAVLLIAQCKPVVRSRSLRMLGRYSLHIMCLQFLAFKAVSIIIVKIYDMPPERLAEYPVVQGVDGIWWILYTIAGCILPVLAVKMYEAIRERVLKK